MDYEKFAAILNRHVFGGTLEELLKRLVEHPERFVGLFRPSTVSEKILQNLIQAREIKFGDAIEEIVRQILLDAGYQEMESPQLDLAYDHLCRTPDGQCVVLIEQKVRDDHDSSKRVGQFQNFERKIEAIINAYPEAPVHAIMYFVDPEFRKNRNFYLQQMQRISYSQASVQLLYGSELFSHLAQVSPLNVTWTDIIEWLKRWKSESARVAKQIDTSPETVRQLAHEKPELFLRLSAHEKLWEEGIIYEVFPDAKPLRMVCDFLAEAQRRGRNVRRRREQLEGLRQLIDKYFGGTE